MTTGKSDQTCKHRRPNTPVNCDVVQVKTIFPLKKKKKHNNDKCIKQITGILEDDNVIENKINYKVINVNCCVYC